MRGILFVALLSLSTSVYANVSDSLAQKLVENRSLPDRVLIYLPEVENLSEALEIQNIVDRRQFVFSKLRDHAEKTQVDLRNYLESVQTEYRPFYITNMILLKNPSRELVRELSMREDIIRIALDPSWKKDDITIQLPELRLSLLSLDQALRAIEVDKVWKELDAFGEGITIAVQDTGIEWTHPAVRRQYRGGDGEHDYHWYDAIREPALPRANRCGYAVEEPCDDHGHGTHVLGTSLGDDLIGNRIGVAPKANWMACRNMDAGEGRPSFYIDCYQFFLAPWPYGGDPFTDGRPDLAADIINNSWGCPLSEGCEGFEMTGVFSALYHAGIANVVSAGNSGARGCRSISDQPATHTNYNIVVGAFDVRFDRAAGFSSRGPSRYDDGLAPHITAPGVNIRSSVLNGRYAGGWNGTSMAAPHVSGALALLWSYTPSLRGHVSESLALMASSAVPKPARESCGDIPGNSIPNHTNGYGLINVWNLLNQSD